MQQAAVQVCLSSKALQTKLDPPQILLTRFNTNFQNSPTKSITLILLKTSPSFKNLTNTNSTDLFLNSHILNTSITLRYYITFFMISFMLALLFAAQMVET